MLHILYDIILLESSMCLMTCDLVIWGDWYIMMWSGYSNSSSKNRKEDELKNEKKMEII